MAGWALSYGGEEQATTDAGGVGAVPCLAPGLFVVKAAPGDPARYQDLYLAGWASAPAFNYTTYTGTRDALKVTLNGLGLTFDAALGIVVVGLDVSNDGSNQPYSLDPAVGAASDLRFVDVPNATISTTTAATSTAAATRTAAATAAEETPTPFIYVGASPQFGAEILPSAQSFVTYPNVPVATSSGSSAVVNATSPPGQECLLAPGLPGPQEELRLEAFPDSITVVTYICA
jgi:hypothetical protein